MRGAAGWLFGDYSYLQQTEKGRKLIVQLERIARIARRPLPGWYDTHARQSTVPAAPRISVVSPAAGDGAPGA